MTTVELPRPEAARRRGTGATPVLPPVVAAAAALIGVVAGWRGTDLPAQLYRITMFHRNGMALWDPQWFGGHWALAYSVVYPPIAGTIGVTVTAVASAAGAALAFDRLVMERFGPTARVGSLLFAVGTAQQLSIGQLSFLMGEALALGACWGAARRRWALAAVLAAAASLASPLAGGFLVLAGVALVLTAPPGERAPAVLVLAGAAIPVAAVAVMFSDPGPFPFSFVDFVFDVSVAVVMWMVAPREDRLLRTGAVLYVAATVTCFAVHNPVGENVGRLAECVAIPLGACVLWPRRRALFVVLAAPMALAVWVPAWGAISGRIAALPSTHRSYYAPLTAFLVAHDGPGGRVEVVPTAYHWEAAYVAPDVPLARGWERQLDIARDPLFYGGRLDASSYRAWLIERGVRFVALPDAPLDVAGRREAQLVEAGVPGLSPVWSDAHWLVFAVDGSDGVVSGPARVVHMSGGRVVLDVTSPGTVTLRVADGAHWQVTAGSGCATATADGVDVAVPRPGTLTLAVGMRAPRCKPSTSVAAPR